MISKYRILVLVLVAWTGLVQAADTDALKAKLEKTLSGVKIDSIKQLGKSGLYQAVTNGEVVYFSADGRYLIQGDVISLESRQNITEMKRLSMRKHTLDKLDEKDMIIYGPKNSQYTLTVFTDIDCPYCRKMHEQMAEYNNLGIRIRYMAFPRAGIGSSSYDKAVNVWCAKDKQQAMTDAKSGKQVISPKCDNPVKKEYKIGQKLGIRGTPALFTESGQLLPGYVPPVRLREFLDKQALSKS